MEVAVFAEEARHALRFFSALGSSLFAHSPDFGSCALRNSGMLRKSWSNV